MNILFSTQPTFLPIIKQLAGRHTIQVANGQFAKLLTDDDLAATSIFNLITPADQAAAIREATRLEHELFQVRPQEAALAKAANDWLAGGGLAEYFYQRLPDLCLTARALELAKPNIIVLHNDVEPFNRFLALWGNAHSIPVLHVPHAIYLETDDRGPAGTDIHDIVTAGHLAAAGTFQAQWYHARDPELKIYLTGIPQFDRLAKIRVDRARAAKLLHLNPALPTLIYMSSWRQNTNLLGCHNGVEDTYRSFLAAYKQLPDVQLIVSCHPRGQNTEWHVREAEKAGVNCIVVGGEHLDIILMLADLVLSYGPSNVILEAATLSNIKLLVTDGFPNDPSIFKVGDETDAILAGILQALLAPIPDYTPLLSKYLGRVDGQAHLRIAELIEKLGAS